MRGRATWWAAGAAGAAILLAAAAAGVAAAAAEPKSDLADRFRAADGDPAAFAEAAHALVREAERRFLAGDPEGAVDLARHVWTSSAPHEARVAAWNVIYLAENRADGPPPAAGHRVVLIAPGARDHRRFEAWIRQALVEPHAWIRDVAIRYEPTRPVPDRAQENARIVFVLDGPQRGPDLLRAVKAADGTYSTRDWLIEERRPIRPADTQGSTR